MSFPATGESSASIVFGSNIIESITSLAPVNTKIGDSVYVLSGSDVTIDCLASGTPAPFITWRRDGRPIKSGDRGGQFQIRQLAGGSRLITQQISVDIQGNFECIATNLGGADRRISTIRVQGEFWLSWEHPGNSALILMQRIC